MIVISTKKRVNLLVTYFVEHEYISAKDIETVFNISKRSVFYWIKDMNNQLRKMKLDESDHLNQSSYFLSQETKKRLMYYDNLQQEYLPTIYANKALRQNIIIYNLIQGNRNLTLTHMSQMFHVTKNTIISDIQHIKNQLPTSFHIKNSPNGKYLIGDETLQRKLIYQLICDNSNLLIIKKMHGVHYRYVLNQLNILQRDANVVFTDYSLEILATFLSWCLKRIQLNPKLSLSTQPNGIRHTDKILLNWITQLMQHFNIDVRAKETLYFTNVIYSAQTRNIPSWNWINKIPVQKLSSQIIERFSQVSGRAVDVKNLQRGLNVHLAALYSRITFEFSFQFSNLDEIKKDYAYLMTLVKFAIKPFEDYVNTPVSENELALITTYFGTESDSNLNFTTAVDVILLCSNGIGSASFLLQTLQNKYPQIHFSKPLNLREFEKYHSILKAKLIISTIKLNNQHGIKSIMINPIPTKKDFLLIDHKFNESGLTSILDTSRLTIDVMDIIATELKITDPVSLEKQLSNYFKSVINPEQHADKAINTLPSISDLLPSENVYVTDNHLDWKQAIKKSFLPLLKNNSITTNYVTEIINKLQQQKQLLLVKKGILLAHSVPSPKVNKTGMSLLKLNTQVSIKGESIACIICLASTKDKQHLKALNDLLKIIQNKSTYQTLINTRDKKIIVDLIRQSQYPHIKLN